MTIKTSKLNHNALVTLDEVKAELQSSPFVPKELDLDDVEVEAVLIRMINSISSQVEMIVGRELGKQEYTEYLTSSSNPTLLLSNYPIRKINSISLIRSGDIKDYVVDSDKIMRFNDKKGLANGKLYIEPSFMPRALLVGLGAYKHQDLRSVGISYEAGYILPMQATDTEPSDLPAAVQGIVLDVVTRVFRERIDGSRSDNLVSLTEGNVSREWGTSVMGDLEKKGYFTKSEQMVLRALGPKKTIYSV